MTSSLLAVFAHPDDETFAAGGTLARAHAEGVRTALYVATDGAAGRASGMDVDGRAELARLRRRELLAAAGVLGVGRVFLPRYPDGELAAVPADDLVTDIVRAIRMVRPQVVVTFGPEGAPNRHRDHRAISRAATAAFFLSGEPARLFYTTWSGGIAESFGVTGMPATCRVAVGDWLEVKRRAFDEHRSQWDHRSRFEMTIEPEELYFLASGPGTPERDLFSSL